IDLNADALYNEKQENLRVWPRSSMFKRRLIAADQASVFMAKMFEQRSSSLVLHQMMSNHNSSDLVPQRQEMSVENVSSGLYFVRTEYQLADMFTKALPEDRFKYLVRRIGMRCLTPADLEVLTNETA
ncbi:hypothetical protein Tco_1099811, partial [Tanacetum coccineum]